MHSTTRRLTLAALVATVCSGLCLSATAQTYRQDAGVYFPGQAVADPRGSLSLTTNPAGLTVLRGAEVRLQMSGGGSWVAGTRGAGWGAFAATPMGRLSLATSLENVRDTPPGGAAPGYFDLNRISFGSALRLGDRLSIGAATRMHGVSGRKAGWSQSWDFGLLVRPWTWLSFGWRVTGMATAADATSASFLRTRYAWGLALRPLGGSDRLTFALDFDWPEDDVLGTITGSLRSRSVEGVAVQLEWRKFNHNRNSAGPALDDSRFGALVEIGLGHWGAEVAMRQDHSALTDSSGGGAQFGVRVSSDVPHSLWEPGTSGVVVPLVGRMQETPGGKTPHFGKVLLDLRAIARDEAIDVVALRARGLRLTWGQVEELRAAIGALRKARKRVVFYADGMGNRTLAVAAACERIGMPISGAMTARGLGVHFVGLKETLHKVGVSFQAVRFGDHKSAPESLTRKQISPQYKETLQRLATTRWRNFVGAVSLGRGVTVTRIAAAIERGVVYPEDARKAGLIDFVGEPRQFEKKLAEWKLVQTGTRLRKYRAKRHRRKTWGQQPRLAVLAIEGNIVDGRGGDGATGRSVGGAQVARLVDRLRKRSEVRGLVARIDSGGGAVRGSDLMYSALKRYGKKKPVVTSMGSVAASGGYWTALGGQTMFADASTITGSIGIFGVKPSLGGLYKRVGLGVDGVGAGPHWDLTSMHRPWTEAESKLLRRVLGRYYALFLTRVTLRRKIQRPKLLTLAEGRLWTGEEARAHGLVDKVGGLWESLEAVKKKAGLAGEDDVTVEFWPRPTFSAIAMRWLGLAGVTTQRPRDPAVDILWRAAAPLLDRAAIAALFEPGSAVAILPIRVDRPKP